MKVFPLFIALFLSIPGSSAASLSVQVEALLKEAGIPVSAIGMAAAPMSGVLIDHHQADRPMRSASLMKLLTTAVALERMGPAWTWPTEIYIDGPIHEGVLHGSLIIKGSGDPTLNLERFWLMIARIRSHGIHTIQGRLIVDQTHFEQSHAAGSRLGLIEPWEIVPKPLLVNLQVERLIFERVQNQVLIRSEPDLGWHFKTDLSITDKPCNTDVEDAWFPIMDWNTNPPTAMIKGEFPRSCLSRTLNIGVTDDLYYIGTLFRQMWKASNGRLLGEVVYGEANPDVHRLLARYHSPPLSLAIVDQNKFSSNPMARQIYLSLGRLYKLPGSDVPRSAEHAIQRWLKEHKLEFPELALENGSGLSRKERLSAGNWVNLLQTMSRSRFAPEYQSSLPVLGIDGTLRRRLTSGPEAGWGRLKTGSLSDTRAVAGYLRTRKGDLRAVAFIVNHPDAGRAWPAIESWLSEQFESE